MSRLQALLLFLALSCVAGLADARTALLVNPEPIAIPAGLSQEQVVKDIKRALIGRGWEVALEEPGKIESTLHLRDHFARVKILYDTRAISVGYLDSRNLDYKVGYKGKVYIHKNYLSWVNNILGDMTTNMQVSAGEK